MCKSGDSVEVWYGVYLRAWLWLVLPALHLHLRPSLLSHVDPIPRHFAQHLNTRAGIVMFDRQAKMQR